MRYADPGGKLAKRLVAAREVFPKLWQRCFRVRLTYWAKQLRYRRVRALAGCGVIGRGPSSRMAILYFLADEPVQNHQQQDCRLIVEVHAPDAADIKWVHAEAEIAMKEKLSGTKTVFSATGFARRLHQPRRRIASTLPVHG
jgi:hypothetical protein